MESSKHPMLSKDVDVKNYGGINIEMSEQEKNSPIPEPAFTPPPFQMDEDEDVAEPQQTKEKKQQQPFNEELEDMSAGEKKRQADAMADMAIGVYSYLHKAAEGLCKINEDKARESHLKGDINLNAKITYDDGTIRTVEQVIVEYNSGTSDVLTVSQEFKDNVRPLLTRILLKKGIGLTDEEMLAYYVVMDLVQKVPIVIQLAKQKKNMYEKLVEISKRPVGATMPPPPTQQATTEQPQQQQSVNPAPSPLAENETVNVKNDGTVETIQIEEEDEPKRRGRRPKSKE